MSLGLEVKLHLYQCRLQVLSAVIFRMFFLPSGALDACFRGFLVRRGGSKRERVLVAESLKVNVLCSTFWSD